MLGVWYWGLNYVIVETFNYFLPAKRHEHIHIWAAQNNLVLCGEAGYPLCEMSVKNVELFEPKASKNCELSEPLGEFLQFSE